MKKFYSFLVLLSFVFSVNAQTEYTIGSNSGANTNTGYPCPIQDYFEGTRTQYLYLASELQAAGMTAGLINSIKFNVTSLNSFTGTVEQLTYSIGTTSVTDLTTSSWEPGTTNVFGPIDYIPTVGPNEFTFVAPFFWDGTSNIILEVCNGDPNSSATGNTTWTGNPSVTWTTALSFNATHTYRADDINYACGTTVTTQTGVQTARPDVTFVWNAAVACSGTPLTGVATSSKDSVCVNQSFQVSLTGGSVGTGLSYQWESSTNNGSTWSPISGANKFSYLVSSISINTCYRRKTTCTNSGLFSYSASKCIVVKPFYECYCSPLTGNVLYSTTGALTPEINNIAINGGTLAYSNAHTPSNVDPKGYNLNVSDTAILLLKQGTTYTATIGTAGTVGDLGIWADWNQNNIFDSLEFTPINYVAGATSTDVDIDVPANAPLGLTMIRFRVVSNFNTINWNQACQSYFNGEVEDYLGKVIPGTPCSGTPIGGTTLSTKDSACPNIPFVLSTTGATTGVTALTYQWEKQDNCTGSWTAIAGATSKNYTVPFITVNSCFRRKITCGASFAYSSVITIYLKSFMECYCSPLTGTVLHTGPSPWINNVALANASGTCTWDAANAGITNLNNALATATPGYAQYLDSTIGSTCFKQAEDATINLTMSAAPSQATAWVDWNRDGQFTLSERYNITTAGVGTINVPSTALPGWTVMRVRIRNANFTEACEQFVSGETEDYIVKVLPGSQCSGSPIGGDIQSSVDSVCKNTAFDLSVANSTSGVIGLTYQWYEAANCGSTFTPIVGATSQGLNIPRISSNTAYKRGIKCNGGTEVFSTTKCIILKSQFDCYCGPKTQLALHTVTNISIDTVEIISPLGAKTYFHEDIGSNTTPGLELGWRLFDDTTISPKFVQGDTYTINLYKSAKDTQSIAYIDYDLSGTFEASETIAITNNKNGTGTFTVPVTATPGFTLMRVRTRNAIISTPCETFGSGETEDHVVKIIPGTPCTGTPIGGTTNSTHSTACKSIPFTLSVTGSSTAAGILGFTYQWQEFTGGIWQNLNTANTLKYTTSLNLVNRTFRRKIKCTNSNDSAYSSSITVTLNSPIYTSLPFNESFEPTWNDGCASVGAHSIPHNSWRNTPMTGDTSWRRNDDGVSANWNNESTGMYSPAASVGSYSARFHTAAPVGNNVGANFDLHLNCASGAQFKRLTYDYINTDGSDIIRILLSTDSGSTFTEIDSISVRTSWSTKSLDFASLSPKTIIRFRAISDAGGSDIGLDNIKVVSLLPVDIAATAIVAPIGSIGATSTGTISLTVKNVGGSVINFATTPMTFGASINGPSGSVALGSPLTINSGTLAINATQNVNASVTTDLSALGNYNFRVWAIAQNDGNNTNDTTSTGLFATTSPAMSAIKAGFWGDANTWNQNRVPIATDTVNITGFAVTLSGGASPGSYVCNSIGIGAGGSLIANADTLIVGPNGGGNRYFNVLSGGTLNVSGGAVKHNGMIIINNGANFTQSGGTIAVDGNDGITVNSVTNAFDIFGIGTTTNPYSTGTLNLTGGNILIVDPHRIGTPSTAAFAYRGTIPYNAGAGHTLTLGNKLTNHTATGFSNGYYLNLNSGGARMSLGNLVVDGGNAIGNRFVSPAANIGINGNFIITLNSEYRSGFQTYVTGNITNNGLYAATQQMNLQTYLSGNAGTVSNTQTISGAGVYRNTNVNSGIAAGGSGYSVGDVLTLTGGLTAAPLTFYVSAINASGAITSAVVLNMGDYNVAPPTAATAANGGTGTGATFTTANVISSAKFAGLNINNNSPLGVNIIELGNNLVAQSGTIGGTSNFRLIDGIINNSVPIILGNSTTQRGSLTYTAGVITGKFTRWFGTIANDSASGVFPVGKTNVCRITRIQFTTPPTKGGKLTAEFIATPSGLAGLPLADGATNLTSTADQGFWRVETDSITGGNYSNTLTYKGLQTVTSLSGLRVVKRPSNGTTWTLDGLNGINSGTLTAPEVTRTGMSGFSEFTVAGDAANVLPSQSITLSGEKAGNAYNLKWVVINEKEVKTFELLRSNDARTFETIGSLNAKGNGLASTTYTYADYRNISSDVYYKVKQTSKDGSIMYSNVLFVRGNKVKELTIGTIYPNPTKDNINVVIAAPKNTTTTISITDLNGKVVKVLRQAVQAGDNVFNLNINTLSAATYMIQVADDNGKSNVVSFIKQ